MDCPLCKDNKVVATDSKDKAGFEYRCLNVVIDGQLRRALIIAVSEYNDTVKPLPFCKMYFTAMTVVLSPVLNYS